MKSTLIMLMIGTLWAGCIVSDHIRVSGQAASALEESRLVKALQADEEVRRVHVSNGRIAAELKTPRGPDTPDVMAFVHVEVIESAGKLPVIQLHMVWQGIGPVGSERRMWEKLLNGLRDRVIARCENWPGK